MWERRYSVVTPDRTDTGRRLYSDSDISRLVLLKKATLVGETIGQIAGLKDEELAQLVGSSGFEEMNTVEDVPAETNEHYLKVCQRAISDFDSAALEASLLQASADLGQTAFLERVLVPLLDMTGESWINGDLKIAHEHLASAVIRSILGSMVLSQQTDSRGPLLLSTTPSGQHHELGALVASVMATSLGWRSLYLGPDMPAEEIASAVKQKNARAVALSIVYPGDDPHLALQLKKLARLLPDNVALLVGGRASQTFTAVLDEMGAIRVGNLAEFRKRLNTIREK